MASNELDTDPKTIVPKAIVPEVTVQEIINPETNAPATDESNMSTKPAEDGASSNFYTHAASLPTVVETESFSDFLHRFTTTSPPLLSSIDVLLLEDDSSKNIFNDLKAHHERACALKLYKRTHYTVATKDLPDDLRSAYRLLMAGSVNNYFPSYNDVDERERKKWKVVNEVLTTLRNVAFEMAGVQTAGPTTSSSSKQVGLKTHLYQQDEPKSPRTPTLLGYGFGKEKEF
ncbi:putative agmatinase 1 [Venturia nashicola]|uniref:Putative agmatinase 1 n=1 Tax=Venturia nashicola TaxID=86259 RepID=A0A4Z1PDY8_9PEZI|nr:putative agmatinase 1 [Venturia nashicola]